MSSPQETEHSGQWCPQCKTDDHAKEAHDILSGQSTEDTEALPLVCCQTCTDTNRMVREVHAAFTGLAAAMGNMAKNPMMAAMGRQFGIDPAAIAGAMKS